MELVYSDIGRHVGRPVEFLPNGGGSDERDTFHLRFDPETESIVDVVVQAVAVIHNEEPLALEPLGEVVDPELLEELFSSAPEEDSIDSEVTFVYEDLEITVHSDGHLWLQWT